MYVRLVGDAGSNDLVFLSSCLLAVPAGRRSKLIYSSACALSCMFCFRGIPRLVGPQPRLHVLFGNLGIFSLPDIGTV